VRIDAEERDNLKKIATVWEATDPTEGALTVTRMCADGKVRDVVAILYRMQAKRAARLITAIEDKDLSATLFDEWKRYSEAPPATG
jgi:hypothetical protein